MSRLEELGKRSSNDSSSFIKVPRILLEDRTDNVLRLVDIEDVTMFEQIWLMCDDGKERPFIVGVENPDTGEWEYSPLRDVIGEPRTFYRGGFLESIKGSDNKKEYLYMKNDPAFFNQFRTNDKGYDRYIATKVLLKAIPRFTQKIKDKEGNASTLNWSEVNNKAMLLELPAGSSSKKQSALEKLLQVGRMNEGNLTDYDIVIQKTGGDYDIYKATSKISNAVVGHLSEKDNEKNNYRIYDAISTASDWYVYKNLRDQITKIDSIMGTRRLDVFEEAYVKHEESMGGSSEGTSSNTFTSAPVVETPSRMPEAAKAPAPAPVRGVTVTPPAPVRGGVKENDLDLECPTPDCSFVYTQGSPIESCPECGTQIQAPCGSCDKPYSVYVADCPHCGVSSQ